MKSTKVFVTFLSFLLLSSAILAVEDDEPLDDDNDENTVTEYNNSHEVDEDFNPRELLLQALLNNAHTKVPPPPQFLPVRVQVKMRPLHIDDVCTKTYHIKVAVLESYNWTDSRLAWNESDFGGIKSMSLDATDIWMPDISVYQSPETSALSTKPKQYRPIISSDGTVLYMPRTELLITCAARSWFNVSAAENSSSVATAATDTPTTNDTGTFACEFDQGSWTYDTTLVDIIPTLATSGLAKPKSDKKLITKDTLQQQRSTSTKKATQQKPKTQKQRKQQRASDATREYTSKDFNATADLSWFEPNQLYDIKSFEAKRNVMQYPGMGTDSLWSSLHYRLVVHVKESSKQSAGISSYDGKPVVPAVAPVTVPIVA